MASNGKTNPRGIQALIVSRMASQIGSISYPICKLALSVGPSFFISNPSIMSLFQLGFSSAMISVFVEIYVMPCLMEMKCYTIVLF